MISKVHEWIFNLDELPRVSIEVMKRLEDDSKGGPFVLWLVGDLGAGKTTFAGALLHALGVPASVPILSPTFTYLTEYDARTKKFAHMDLYRLVEGDTDSLESLLAGRQYAGILVEWPERAADSPLIEKTHELRFFICEDSDCRRLQLWV